MLNLISSWLIKPPEKTVPYESHDGMPLDAVRCDVCQPMVQDCTLRRSILSVVAVRSMIDILERSIADKGIVVSAGGLAPSGEEDHDTLARCY